MNRISARKILSHSALLQIKSNATNYAFTVEQDITVNLEDFQAIASPPKSKKLKLVRIIIFL